MQYGPHPKIGQCRIPINDWCQLYAYVHIAGYIVNHMSQDCWLTSTYLAEIFMQRSTIFSFFLYLPTSYTWDDCGTVLHVRKKEFCRLIYLPICKIHKKVIFHKLSVKTNFRQPCYAPVITNSKNFHEKSCNTLNDTDIYFLMIAMNHNVEWTNLTHGFSWNNWQACPQTTEQRLTRICGREQFFK